VNLDALRIRAALAALNMLPASVRDEMLRAQLQKILDSAPGGAISLGMVIGTARDVLPRDEMLVAAFNIFAEELWRWWRDGGGK
jgi:hypothetical protein